jgi:hypothetical protein
MAEIKRRTLLLSTGKQIKLYGNSLAIGSTLEVGEGAAPNLFSIMEQLAEPRTVPESIQNMASDKLSKDKTVKKSTTIVLNPHRLTKEEIIEVADLSIQLWMNLKESVRRFGVNNSKVFNSDY